MKVSEGASAENKRLPFDWYVGEKPLKKQPIKYIYIGNTLLFV